MVQTTIMTSMTKATPASKANKSMGNSSNKSLNWGFLSGKLVSSQKHSSFWKFSCYLSYGLLGLALSSCVTQPSYTHKPPQSSSVEAKPSSYSSSVAKLTPTSWNDLPGWYDDDLSAAWPAWKRSCQGLMKRNPSGVDWRPACRVAERVNATSNQSIRDYFESHMKVMEIRHQTGSSAGSNWLL